MMYDGYSVVTGVTPLRRLGLSSVMENGKLISGRRTIAEWPLRDGLAGRVASRGNDGIGCDGDGDGDAMGEKLVKVWGNFYLPFDGTSWRQWSGLGE